MYYDIKDFISKTEMNENKKIENKEIILKKKYVIVE